MRDAQKTLKELLVSLEEALGDEPHDFDMSDDQYLSPKRRRLLDAMVAAEELLKRIGK